MSLSSRAALAAACLAATISPALAGGEKVAFPAEYMKGELYGTLDRYDSKQFREFYTSPEVVKAVRAGQPIPHGAVITMVVHKAKLDDKGNPVKGADGRFVKDELSGIFAMEKRAGWGAEYPEELRNGEWEYQAFTKDGKVNEKANLKACFMCHKPHEKQDFVISLAKLAGTGPVVAMAKPAEGEIAIVGFKFDPGKVAAAVGRALTWRNADDSPHQILVAARNLRSAVMQKGQSASLTFDAPGMYDYVCGLHPSMEGQIEVK